MKNSLEQEFFNHGITLPNKPITAGSFLRWGKNNRFYARARGEGYIFGDLKEGAKGCWFPRDLKSFSLHEKKAYYQKLAEDKQNEEQNQLLAYKKAAVKAEYIWSRSKILTSSSDHPYLAKKNINPNGTRLYKDSLIIPVMDISGKICSLQFINVRGEKTFLKGGQKKSCFYMLGAINKNSEAIIICEGFATAATLYEINKLPTICAFDVGNLEHVAEVVRNNYPNKKIIIAADNDQYSDNNIGLDTANKVANKYDCIALFPEFNDEVIQGNSREGNGIKLANITKPTDFNDKANLGSEQAIKAQFDEVLKNDN